MAGKCTLCEGKIEDAFLGKIRGTLVKIKDEKKNKNQLYAVCRDCQKKYPDVKEEVMKTV